MSTYEELQIILATALLIVAILAYTHKKIAVLFFGENDNYGNINSCSYLRHEFEQAKKKKKTIIIVYNSTRRESSWLPSYMDGYEDDARPFWKIDDNGKKVGDYSYIKEVLGF